MLLTGKWAFITGCNRGIGKAILEKFAINGANIWAHSRMKNKEFEDLCHSLEEQYSIHIKCVYFDLEDDEAMIEAIKQIRQSKTGIDVLVNNAGIIHTSLFEMTTTDQFNYIMQVNFFLQMKLTQYILRIMKKKVSGSIIHMSSSAAIDCNEGRIAYTASKAAILSAGKVQAKELGAYGIRVNIVAPGLTQTDMMEESTPLKDKRETVQRTCLKRVGNPEEIAQVVVFLASDMSSYITNQVIRVDGGMF